MHFVHSLWTKPAIVNRRDIKFIHNIIITTFCNATSVAWLTHLGAKIDLYADGFGIDMLDYLPYDNIHHLKVKDIIPTCNWAAGKFIALEHMPLGDVHIDGDVFIKTDKAIELINQPGYDFVVQSLEDNRDTLVKYYTESRNILKRNNIKTRSCSLDEMPSYNCGTIGFFNEDLKHKYLMEYFTALESIIKNKIALGEFTANLQAIPDLILEQQFLYELSHGYKVNNLLGNYQTEYDKAIELGYQHILGGFKITEFDNIKAELKYIDPDIYNKTIKHLKYIYTD